MAAAVVTTLGVEARAEITCFTKGGAEGERRKERGWGKKREAREIEREEWEQLWQGATGGGGDPAVKKGSGGLAQTWSIGLR